MSHMVDMDQFAELLQEGVLRATEASREQASKAAEEIIRRMRAESIWVGCDNDEGGPF